MANRYFAALEDAEREYREHAAAAGTLADTPLSSAAMACGDTMDLICTVQRTLVARAAHRLAAVGMAGSALAPIPTVDGSDLTPRAPDCLKGAP